jgi:hypothetical protein
MVWNGPKVIGQKKWGQRRPVHRALHVYLLDNLVRSTTYMNRLGLTAKRSPLKRQPLCQNNLPMEKFTRL